MILTLQLEFEGTFSRLLYWVFDESGTGDEWKGEFLLLFEQKIAFFS